MHSDKNFYLLTTIAVVLSLTGLLFAILSPDTSLNSLTVTISVLAAGYAAIVSIFAARYRERKRLNRQVFLMYKHADLEDAKRISEELKKLGYKPWLDVEQIVPGQRWMYAVGKGLGQSAVAILLVSKNYTDDGFLQKELKAALDGMRSASSEYSPVIPVIIDGSDVPQDLSGVHAVDLRQKDALELLDRGLRNILVARVEKQGRKKEQPS